MLQVTLKETSNTLTLSNGLITRQFTLSPAFGTIDYRSELKQRSILRTITKEASVTLDGVVYSVGGLQINSDTHAYLNRTMLNLTADPNAFQYVNHSYGPPKAPFHWEPGLRHSPLTSRWPPAGLTLKVMFTAPKSAKPNHRLVTVTVNYEMYVGIPLLAKWVTLDYMDAEGMGSVYVNDVTVEYLSTQKPYNMLSYSQYPRPWDHSDTGITASWLYAQSNQAHGSECTWVQDSMASKDYGADEQILQCKYTEENTILLGNDKVPNSLLTVDTFRALELVTDSTDRERVSLSRHRMTRLLAPETQENPIFFHGTDHTDQVYCSIHIHI